MLKDNDLENPDLFIPVSVVMCVYDGNKLNELKVAVDSILNQTFTKYEFIIVLDGVKREDIKSYLEDLKNSDERVKLIHLLENKGAANAINHAIKSAKGEFIVRMDADDVSHRKRVEKLVEYMQSNDDIDVSGSFIEEFSGSDPSKINKIRIYPTEHEAMKKYFAKSNPLGQGPSIFRRRFFEKAGYYPLFSPKNEDTLLWLSGFINDCKFSNLPEVLYSVRFNKGTGSRRIGLKKSFSDLVDRLRVIIDLNASWVNIIYAIGLFIVQSMPYPIYMYIRSILIHRKSIK